MIPFFAALQFLTLCPPLIKRAFTGKELGRAVAFYPLIGLLLGILIAGFQYGLSQLLPPAVRSALVLAFWVLLSGALHLDGFLDSLDGLFGGISPQQRLDIMHDERVGAYGFAGGILLLLIKFAALSTFPAFSPILILIPTLSRWAMAAAVVLFPYAREKGLGREIKNNARTTELVLATLMTMIVAWLVLGWNGIIALGFAALLTVLIGLLVLRKLPGLTGDIYGALNELIEFSFLVIFTGGMFS